MGTPAPSWLTHVTQGVPTQKECITGTFFRNISCCLTLALTQVFPPETRTLTKYLVLPRSSQPHERDRSCTGTVWEDAVQGSFGSSWNLPKHYLVEVHCSKIWLLVFCEPPHQQSFGFKEMLCSPLLRSK